MRRIGSFGLRPGSAQNATQPSPEIAPHLRPELRRGRPPGLHQINCRVPPIPGSRKLTLRRIRFWRLDHYGKDHLSTPAAGVGPRKVRWTPPDLLHSNIADRTAIMSDAATTRRSTTLLHTTETPNTPSSSLINRQRGGVTVFRTIRT